MVLGTTVVVESVEDSSKGPCMTHPMKPQLDWEEKEFKRLAIVFGLFILLMVIIAG